MDFSVIKDDKLRSLLENSAYFQFIEEEEKRNFLQAISSFGEAEQKKMCVFFVESKGKEVKKSEEEKEQIVSAMDRFVDELKAVVGEFKRSLLDENEKISVRDETKAQEELLKQIEQC